MNQAKSAPYSVAPGAEADWMEARCMDQEDAARVPAIEPGHVMCREKFERMLEEQKQ